MKYTVKNGVIRSKKGIPCTPRFIVDGRLSFRYDQTGVEQVGFKNPAQAKGNSNVFLKKLWDGFRFYLEKDKLNYKPEYANTEVWPFSIEAEWSFLNAVVRHKVMAVDESIVFQVLTPANMPSDTVFKLEFYNAFGLTPLDAEDIRFCDMGVDRKWEEWQFDQAGNRLLGGFRETVKGVVRASEEREYDTNHYRTEEHPYEGCELHIGIGADFAVHYRRTPLNIKHILSSPVLEPGRTYSFVVSFHPEKTGLSEKMTELIGRLEKKVGQQYARYTKAAELSPRLISPYKRLNDYLSLIPVCHESLKVNDRPGAIKANSYAWVWCWDGITASFATAYWNDTEHLRDMLRFYRDTADEKLGLALALSNDMRFLIGCALPSQGMYITLLQLYYSATGDAELVREIYPFAKWLFDKTLTLERSGTGLCEGPSMYPDFPIFMKETGQDLSGLNNTIFYCAARSMEYLAVLAGDRDTAEEARQTIRRIEENFLDLFFDRDKGYIVSSVDSVTLEKRNSFNSNSVKWENNYCRELMEPVSASCLEFFDKHIVSEAGLREIPAWSDAYDQDANQLHCWWPVTGEYFMRLANEHDRKDLIEKWIGWISYWSEMLMCPEGISCYVETSRPELDRWNTISGLWYGYSMRGWYQAAIHGVFGLDADAGGITFFPYSGEEMALHNFRYRGQIYDFEMKGSGPYIASIVVNGKEIKGTNKLPFLAAGNRKRNKVQVNRVTHRPQQAWLKYGYGIELLDIDCEEGAIKARLSGVGTCRLKIAAAAKPNVAIDGHPAETHYDEASGIATLELIFEPGEIKSLFVQ
ncbi:hypothetical protein [Paenibacillus montanisoli]|uniref:Alpha-L-rhamnosidase six-hairpin glycosidase domain-containing protein n=1 Tax=Paenibacillus montanisoli TaxID=2081970 RepID=A0A328U3K9_9BACL|nr:hypothetical protein [Paenibacillus montanisoli]RAP76041.1 hypothetical protein DL346_11495 [Paenibacillus montanisoli]